MTPNDKQEKQGRMEKAEQLAKEYFREGLNCSESVMRAFLDLHETPLPPEIVGLTTGFGGGIGRTKNICGAVSGAVMAVGVVKGRADPFAKEDRKERAKELTEIYKPFAAMIAELKDSYGTIICGELSDPFADFEAKERKKNCQQIIGRCAALSIKYADGPL